MALKPMRKNKRVYLFTIVDLPIELHSLILYFTGNPLKHAHLSKRLKQASEMPLALRAYFRFHPVERFKIFGIKSQALGDIILSEPKWHRYLTFIELLNIGITHYPELIKMLTHCASIFESFSRSEILELALSHRELAKIVLYHPSLKDVLDWEDIEDIQNTHFIINTETIFKIFNQHHVLSPKDIEVLTLMCAHSSEMAVKLFQHKALREYLEAKHPNFIYRFSTSYAQAYLIDNPSQHTYPNASMRLSKIWKTLNNYLSGQTDQKKNSALLKSTRPVCENQTACIHRKRFDHFNPFGQQAPIHVKCELIQRCLPPGEYFQQMQAVYICYVNRAMCLKVFKKNPEYLQFLYTHISDRGFSALLMGCIYQMFKDLPSKTDGAPNVSISGSHVPKYEEVLYAYSRYEKNKLTPLKTFSKDFFIRKADILKLAMVRSLPKAIMVIKQKPSEPDSASKKPLNPTSKSTRSIRMRLSECTISRPARRQGP